MCPEKIAGEAKTALTGKQRVSHSKRRKAGSENRPPLPVHHNHQSLQVNSDHELIPLSSAKADQPLLVNSDHQLLPVKADHQPSYPIAVDYDRQSLPVNSNHQLLSVADHQPLHLIAVDYDHQPLSVKAEITSKRYQGPEHVVIINNYSLKEYYLCTLNDGVWLNDMVCIL